MFKFTKYYKLVKPEERFMANLNANSVKNKSLFKAPKKFQSNQNNLFFSLPLYTKYILLASTTIFGIGIFMKDSDYIKTFFYHKYAMRHGKYHVLITSHFAKANFVDFAIESLLIGLIGSTLEPTLSSPVFLKLILSSVGIGSAFLLAFHKEDTFFKSEAIFRAMIMCILFKNPQQSFMLFPLPFQIKAWILGALLVALDFYTKKWANFGGTIAGYAVATGLL